MKRKPKNTTEKTLTLPAQIEKWETKSRKKSLPISDKSVMIYLLNISRKQKFTAREDLNQKIGSSRYNLLIKIMRSIIEQAGENIAAIKAEALYQNTQLIAKKLAQELELPESNYSLYDLIKELVVKIPKDHIKLPDPGKINKQKKAITAKNPANSKTTEKLAKSQKTPTIVIKKKLKLPPKVIIIE